PASSARLPSAINRSAVSRGAASAGVRGAGAAPVPSKRFSSFRTSISRPAGSVAERDQDGELVGPGIDELRRIARLLQRPPELVAQARSLGDVERMGARKLRGAGDDAGTRGFAV